MPIDRFNTDPSYWEEILIKEGCLGLEDEKKSFGDISLSEDSVDQEIVAELARQSESIKCNDPSKSNIEFKYLGSPSSLESLMWEMRHSLRTLKDSLIEVHPSCVNGEDSINVFQEGGSQHTFNTYATEGYTRQELKKTIQKTVGLGLIEK